MAAFKFGDVERNLPPKGFALDERRDHRYFYFYWNGKKTRFYTKISHGKPNDDVGDDLVTAMKLQLGLGTMKQVRELVECTMSGQQYAAALISSGKLPQEAKEAAESGRPRLARPGKR